MRVAAAEAGFGEPRVAAIVLADVAKEDFPVITSTPPSRRPPSPCG